MTELRRPLLQATTVAAAPTTAITQRLFLIMDVLVEGDYVRRPSRRPLAHGFRNVRESGAAGSTNAKDHSMTPSPAQFAFGMRPGPAKRPSKYSLLSTLLKSRLAQV